MLNYEPELDFTKLNKLPQYWLTTTLNAGNFYEDDRYELIDYRPFWVIDDVRGTDGRTIFPKKSERFIPLGTLVQVVDILYPSQKPFTQRPQGAPADNILVMMRVAKERGRVTMFHEKLHVLIVPKSVKNDEINTYLKRFLSMKDPNRWLLQQQSHLQNNIFIKRPVLGMKRPHLISALGPALKKQIVEGDAYDRPKEIWQYHDYLVTIIDDEVANIVSMTSKKAAP